MQAALSILDWASVSPLGSERREIWQNYLKPETKLQLAGEWTAPLQPADENRLKLLRSENHRFGTIDRSVLLAILAARKLRPSQANCGLSIGSSRGATSLFEKYHKDFLEGDLTSPLTSPSTTLGNLSSWVGQDLGLRGYQMSHSVTCSTAMHSILNAVAWISAGFSDTFLAGGTEAPLTPFTISQMKAMRIYAGPSTQEFPCRAFDLDQTRNSMALGEGAALFHIGKAQTGCARLCGLGYATEEIQHGSSISDDGRSLREAMEMALQGFDRSSIDAVVLHSPGTKKGDRAEFEALKAVFPKLPLVTNNKWKIGHTLGASGALSLEFALLMLEHQVFIGLPWEETFTREQSLRYILVNSVGFGGNAVSILLKKADA